MTISLEAGAIPEGLGIIKPLELPATKYRQGTRQMYNVVITVGQLSQLIVKRPDPNVPIEGNRKVDGRRALAFGRYVQNKDTWVAPAIIVRAPSGDVTFNPAHEFGDGTAWGTLSIPIQQLTDIQILDGQHRTLGFFNAIDEMNSKITKTRETELAAERNQDDATKAMYTKQLVELRRKRDRVMAEHISIDLAVVNSKESTEMFVDINNNSKGVNPDYTSYLDRRDVVNRVSADLMEKHPLLVGRVEIGQGTRMSMTNPNLLGAKGVADIVRAVHVGASGRIGARVDDEMRADETKAIRRVERFLDVMVDSFPDLQAVRDGALTPIELRNTSMLGSLTMWRVLASVYRELTAMNDRNPEPFSRIEVQTFFESLGPEMKAIPVTDPESFWMQTGAFKVGGSAPQAMQGALIQLANALTARARETRVLDHERSED
ncbi:hypothetical protein J2X55_003474 [Microbacterium sp. 1154]|uniref:DNA sulfur modification protein DndB n=1 Tax=Microbacterium sp. 1154 TaxID=2817733 RepID=UPI0028607BE7|nr:DNA sulfur modification protein DndB [Microbacterium sp. 1154]MDR6692529.1 hypothetical protein [Microbacterium sp. 1154]